MSEEKNKKGYLEKKVIGREIKYPNEPERWVGNDINAFLLWANDNRASDIIIQAEEQIIVDINGKLYRATNRKLNKEDISNIILEIYGSSYENYEKEKINDFHDLNWEYEIKTDSFKIVNFSINIISIFAKDKKGVQITARTMIYKN